MTSQYHGFTGMRVRLGVLYQRKTGSLDVNGCQLSHRMLAPWLAGKASQRTRGSSLLDTRGRACCCYPSNGTCLISECRGLRIRIATSGGKKERPPPGNRWILGRGSLNEIAGAMQLARDALGRSRERSLARQLAVGHDVAHVRPQAQSFQRPWKRRYAHDYRHASAINVFLAVPSRCGHSEKRVYLCGEHVDLIGRGKQMGLGFLFLETNYISLFILTSCLSMWSGISCHNNAEGNQGVLNRTIDSC